MFESMPDGSGFRTPDDCFEFEKCGSRLKSGLAVWQQVMNARNPELIDGRFLRAIHHKHINRSLHRLQLEAELLLNCRVRSWRCVRITRSSDTICTLDFNIRSMRQRI